MSDRSFTSGSKASLFAALLPRHTAALLAIAGIAGALAYGISRETPVGSVHGRVVFGVAMRS